MRPNAFILAVALSTPAGVADAQQVLKNEPPVGGLRSGEVVFVDNGKCPKGQILRFSAGVMVGRNPTAAGGQGRKRECVPRPPGT